MDVFYGEFPKGYRSNGRLLQGYRNVCKRDLRDCNIDITVWEFWETRVEDREA